MTTETYGYSEADYADAVASGHAPAPEAEAPEEAVTVETTETGSETPESDGTPLFDETSKADGKPEE